MVMNVHDDDGGEEEELWQARACWARRKQLIKEGLLVVVVEGGMAVA